MSETQTAPEGQQGGYYQIIKKLEAEIDRLRAERDELWTFVSNFSNSQELSGRSMLLFLKAARELLVKVALPCPERRSDE